MSTLILKRNDGCGDADTMADDVERIAGFIRQGYTSGRVAGGWWQLQADYEVGAMDPGTTDIE